MEASIRLWKGDITTLQVDAIVNAANNALMGGGGVDGAIHRAAGPELKAACKLLHGCETGDAKITKGFNLPAKHVIHAVGPVWYGGMKNEAQLLRGCYQRSLELVAEHGLKSIAFPSISTGAYRYPFDQASTIAIDTICGFMQAPGSLEEVTLVSFSDSDHRNLERLLHQMGINNIEP